MIPDEYDLTLEAERLGGASELAIGFTWQGQPAVLVVDFAGQKTGFAGLPKPLHAKPVLPKGELVSLFIQVRKGRVTVRADEWDLLTLEGSDKPPPVPDAGRPVPDGETICRHARFVDRDLPLVARQVFAHDRHPAARRCRGRGGSQAVPRFLCDRRRPVTQATLGNPFKSKPPAAMPAPTATAATTSEPRRTIPQPGRGPRSRRQALPLRVCRTTD